MLLEIHQIIMHHYLHILIVWTRFLFHSSFVCRPRPCRHILFPKVSNGAPFAKILSYTLLGKKLELRRRILWRLRSKELKKITAIWLEAAEHDVCVLLESTFPHHVDCGHGSAIPDKNQIYLQLSWPRNRRYYTRTV